MRWSNSIGAILALAGVALAGTAGAEEMRELVRRAIQEGRATGTVTGSVAQALSSGTKGTGDVLARIEVIGEFKDPQCKRLQVTVSQRDVPTLQGPRTTITLPTMALNMCLDGNPPEESRSPEAMSKNLDRFKGQILQVDPGASRYLSR